MSYLALGAFASHPASFSSKLQLTLELGHVKHGTTSLVPFEPFLSLAFSSYAY